MGKKIEITIVYRSILRYIGVLEKKREAIMYP